MTTTTVDLTKDPSMPTPMRENIAYDRSVATSRPCSECGSGCRFDYHYRREPYEYRAYAICFNGHIDEF